MKRYNEMTYSDYRRHQSRKRGRQVFSAACWLVSGVLVGVFGCAWLIYNGFL